MCYVGKATKIFIFIITVLVVTGLIVGIGVLRRTIHPKSHKCSGESCYQSDFFPPPPPPLPEFPISSNPSDPTSNPSPFPPPPPPPESSGSSSNLSPPPAAVASPPPSGSSSDRTPPPPPAVVVSTGSPPPPAPPVVVAAPPPALNPPSPVPVTPGPANSS